MVLGLILVAVTIMLAPSLLHPGETGHLGGGFDGTLAQGRRSLISFGLMSLALIAFGLWNIRSGRARLHLYFTAGLAFSAILLFGQTWSAESDGGSEDYLVKIAGELNRGAPRMMDRETRLDRAFASGKMLTLNLTMVNITADNIDHRGHELESELRANVCKTPLAKDVLGKGGSLNYDFKGKDGRRLSEVRVTEALCR